MDNMQADWSAASWQRARCKSAQCPEIAVRDGQVAVRNSTAPGGVAVFDVAEVQGLIGLLNEQIG